TATFPELVAILDAVDGDAQLDGEIVALDDKGRPSFERIQQRSGLTKHGDVEAARKKQKVEYFVFDAITLDGEDVTKLPYDERRDRVEDAIRETGPIKVPGDAGSDLKKALATSKRLGLEGVMAKRRDSPY